MALLRIKTEEFVRHYRLLIERTGNDPNGITRALDEYPALAASIERLHELQELIERHRKFSKHRFVVQAHPKFSRALKDFQERWVCAYKVLRDRSYIEALLRISGEFVQNYRLLVERTGNDLGTLKDAVEKQPELGEVIAKLDDIGFALDAPRELWESTPTRTYDIQQLIANTRDLGRFIAHAPPQFCKALADFNGRWTDAWRALHPVRSFEERREQLMEILPATTPARRMPAQSTPHRPKGPPAGLSSWSTRSLRSKSPQEAMADFVLSTRTGTVRPMRLTR